MRQSTRVTLILLGWILCFSLVNAQAAVFGVSTSLKPSICAPVNISWSGGTPPFTPRINVDDQRTLLPEVTARTAQWLPEVAEDVTITILDSAGRQSTSGIISISGDCPVSTQPSSSSTSQPTSSPTPSDQVAQGTRRDPEALIIGLATGLSILFTLVLITTFIICRRRQRRNAKQSGWAVIRLGKKTRWEDVSLQVDLESKGQDGETKAGHDSAMGRTDSLNKTALRIVPPLPAPYHARLDSVTSSSAGTSRQTPRSFDGIPTRPLGSSGDSTGTGRRTLRFIPPATPPPSPSADFQEPPSPAGSFGTTRSSILIHDRHSDIWTFDRNPFLSGGGGDDQDLPTRLSDLLLLEAQRAPRAGLDTANTPSL